MLDRKAAPEVKEIIDYALPSAEVKKMPGGSRLHFMRNSTQPVIRFEIVFPAGKWYEPQKGVSFLTSKLLMEGTKNKSAKQIADILDFYGASLECNQGFDNATLTLYCLSKYLPDLLPLVKEILEEPAFPEKEFELLRLRTAQNLSIERKKPAYLAMERFTAKIYGANHPYVSGLKESDINAVELNQIKSFFGQTYLLPDSEIFACGDLNENLQKLVEDFTNSLSTLVNNNSLEQVKHSILPEPTLENIPMEGSMQAAVRMGEIFPLINHPDYLKLNVVNKILGGYFGSRLMKNIREDKGYTYGIYSSLSPRKYSTLFFIGTDVNVNNAWDTVDEVKKEINKLKVELVSEEEFHTVKNYMIGKFLNETNNIFDQCDRYKHIIIHELPLDHYSWYLKTIREISAEEVRTLMQKYFASPSTISIAGTA
jgi:zinc protease